MEIHHKNSKQTSMLFGSKQTVHGGRVPDNRDWWETEKDMYRLSDHSLTIETGEKKCATAADATKYLNACYRRREISSTPDMISSTWASCSWLGSYLQSDILSINQLLYCNYYLYMTHTHFSFFWYFSLFIIIFIYVFIYLYYYYLYYYY